MPIHIVICKQMLSFVTFLEMFGSSGSSSEQKQFYLIVYREKYYKYYRYLDV